MKHKIFIISCFILLLTSGCKKNFLTVVNKTVLLKEGYVVDLATTGEYLNGVYTDMGTKYTGGFNLPYPEIAADNIKMLKTAAFLRAYNWSFSANVISAAGSGDPVLFWNNLYGMIRSCNFVMEKADEFKNQNEPKANDIKGEALALRAMFHFTLCNMFAQAYNFTSDGSHPGIPYVTFSKVEIATSRQTVAEVYNLMIQDLTTAIELLPKGASFERRKMNYQAAKALLARVYLFKENYAAAKDLSRQVLTDVPLLASVDYPAKLYTDQDNEALFWQPPGATNGAFPTAGYSTFFIGYYASKAGTLYYVATKDIALLLNENQNDKRRSWIKTGGGVDTIKKFPSSLPGASSVAELNYNQSLFRSSEMCLTAAEAFAKLNMEDSARYFINQIRQRAGLNAFSATGAPLLDSIYKERRKEMAFDGLRMWDLKRWKMGVNRVDVFGAAPHTMPYPSNLAVAAIPLNDVLLSGLQQNPGY